MAAQRKIHDIMYYRSILVAIAGAFTGSLVPRGAAAFSPAPTTCAVGRSTGTGTRLLVPALYANIYDDWRSDGVVDTMPLDEDNVELVLQELIESDYGKSMFGVHDMPAAAGITGMLDFVEIAGPEVILRLSGAFWHRRETVLGRAAMYLNARIPEIVEVNVEDTSELEDFEDVVDEDTGEILGRNDKRAPDFNGDRATMEYQGIDPDTRGPFPSGVGGLRPGGSMINPT